MSGKHPPTLGWLRTCAGSRQTGCKLGLFLFIRLCMNTMRPSSPSVGSWRSKLCNSTKVFGPLASSAHRRPSWMILHLSWEHCLAPEFERPVWVRLDFFIRDGPPKQSSPAWRTTVAEARTKKVPRVLVEASETVSAHARDGTTCRGTGS